MFSIVNYNSQWILPQPTLSIITGTGQNFLFVFAITELKPHINVIIIPWWICIKTELAVNHKYTASRGNKPRRLDSPTGAQDWSQQITRHLPYKQNLFIKQSRIYRKLSWHKSYIYIWNGNISHAYLFDTYLYLNIQTQKIEHHPICTFLYPNNLVY